jgi:hypothetical protein
MIKVLALLLCLLGVSPAAAGAKPDPYELQSVINSFQFDGVEVTVGWRKCGQVNAFYYYNAKRVVLCNELQKLPAGVIRYILAHELSHAVIMQLDVAYTTHHEGAADELAALMLIWTGREEDVLAGAVFWATLDRPEDPFDDHFGDMRRAVNLACLVAGSKDEGLSDLGCTGIYRRATRAWVRLLDLQ